MTSTVQPSGDLNHMDLIAAVAAESGVSKAVVDKVLRATFDVIGRTVANNGRVKITNFGSWFRRIVPNTRNPQTGESLGPSATARFRASGKLADAVKAGVPADTLRKNRS